VNQDENWQPTETFAEKLGERENSDRVLRKDDCLKSSARRTNRAEPSPAILLGAGLQIAGGGLTGVKGLFWSELGRSGGIDRTLQSVIFSCVAAY
jgi:hypothetical protein